MQGSQRGNEVPDGPEQKRPTRAANCAASPVTQTSRKHPRTDARARSRAASGNAAFPAANEAASATGTPSSAEKATKSRDDRIVTISRRYASASGGMAEATSTTAHSAFWQRSSAEWRELHASLRYILKEICKIYKVNDRNGERSALLPDIAADRQSCSRCRMHRVLLKVTADSSNHRAFR